MPSDKVAGGQIEHEAAIHLLVEGKVEVIERVEITKAGRFPATFQEPIVTTSKFVAH